jgi:hypothetical protein
MVRKAVAISFLALALGSVSEVQAQSRNTGIGVIVGEPTGLSLKFWQSRATALDLAAAWSIADDNAFHIHGDLLFHEFGAIRVDSGRLPFYYGIGARVRFADRDQDAARVGLRIPLGLDYLFGGGTPLDIFFEVVPILDVSPYTDFTLNASIGLRFWP